MFFITAIFKTYKVGGMAIVIGENYVSEAKNTLFEKVDEQSDYIVAYVYDYQEGKLIGLI